MFCEQCGSELVEGDAFCWNCGVPVQRGNEPLNAQNMDDAFSPSTQPPQSDANASAPTVVIPVPPAQSDYHQPGAQPGQYIPQQPPQYPPQSQYQQQFQTQPQQKKSNTGLIVGIIIGVSVIIAAILIVVFVIRPFGPASPAATTSSENVNSATGSPSAPSSSPSSSTSRSSSTSTANRSGSVTLSVTTAGGERISGDVRRDSNGYVIADSSTREYSFNELKAMNLSDAELCVAWNEPFARNGYHFKNPDLQKYFESCSWYHDTGNSSNLTGAAAANNSTLRSIAEERGSARRWMDLASR